MKCSVCGKEKDNFANKKTATCTTCYARLRYQERSKKIKLERKQKEKIIPGTGEGLIAIVPPAQQAGKHYLSNLFTELLNLNEQYRVKIKEYQDKCIELRKALDIWRGEAMKKRGEILAELRHRIGDEAADLAGELDPEVASSRGIGDK